MSLMSAFASSNGLRVTDRTSQGISLEWPVENTLVDMLPGMEKVELEEEAGEKDEEEEEEEVEGRWERDGNWWEVEMKKEQSEHWCCVYRGYGSKCVVSGLAPDLALVFRMKRNKEDEWGTEVEASTAPSPATVEDLNRGIEMNSEYLVSRILNLSRPPHLKKILSARDRNGMTALMVACHMGNVKIAERLIRAGCEVNAESSGACRTALIFAGISGHLGVIVLLDKNMANWQHRDKTGLSCVHYAIQAGHLEVVKLGLGKLGTKWVSRKDKRFGWSPIMRAAMLSDSLDMIRFLISKGANPNSTDKNKNKSVLLAAILAKKPKVVCCLLQAGADPYFQNENGKNCLEMAKILAYREITEIITEHIKAMESRQNQQT